jgi:hypothetical protein
MDRDREIDIKKISSNQRSGDREVEIELTK